MKTSVKLQLIHCAQEDYIIKPTSSSLSSLQSKRLGNRNTACKVHFVPLHYLIIFWTLILWAAINVLFHIKIVHEPSGKTSHIPKSCQITTKLSQNKNITNSQQNRVLAPTSTYHNSNFIFFMYCLNFYMCTCFKDSSLVFPRV